MQLVPKLFNAFTLRVLGYNNALLEFVHRITKPEYPEVRRLVHLVKTNLQGLLFISE